MHHDTASLRHSNTFMLRDVESPNQQTYPSGVASPHSQTMIVYYFVITCALNQCSFYLIHSETSDEESRKSFNFFLLKNVPFYQFLNDHIACHSFIIVYIVAHCHQVSCVRFNCLHKLSLRSFRNSCIRMNTSCILFYMGRNLSPHKFCFDV